MLFYMLALQLESECMMVPSTFCLNKNSYIESLVLYCIVCIASFGTCNTQKTKQNKHTAPETHKKYTDT